MVSGIGCSGRSAGFFDLDSVHTAHGRALPVAEGIKLANEELNVMVISGDWRPVWNRRESPPACFQKKHRHHCNMHFKCYYGMTGGQCSPATEISSKTLTTPRGNVDTPVNCTGYCHGTQLLLCPFYHIPL
jgi:2-oxoglutarate ferredoxin oxidoreductase subunit beta